MLTYNNLKRQYIYTGIISVTSPPPHPGREGNGEREIEFDSVPKVTALRSVANSCECQGSVVGCRYAHNSVFLRFCSRFVER